MLAAVTADGAPLPADQLWERARALLEQSSNLVAGELTTDMEMIDGSGHSMGTMRIEEVTSGWKNGEPVRRIIANNNPQHADVAKSRFKVAIDSHPDLALREAQELTRLGQEVVDGKSCVVFQVSGKKNKLVYKSKVWIEEASALPIKAVHDFSGIPMMKSMSHSITFGRATTGQWLPAAAVVDATVSSFLGSMKIVSKYQFRAWAARPSIIPQA